MSILTVIIIILLASAATTGMLSLGFYFFTLGRFRAQDAVLAKIEAGINEIRYDQQSLREIRHDWDNFRELMLILLVEPEEIRRDTARMELIKLLQKEYAK